MIPGRPPVVSVVLPVCNAASTLPRALDSLRAQTLAGWEVVAVDDGSTDGSPEILDACARRDPRVRVVRRCHGGIVAALNHGLEHARGGFIARMDADDASHPERLAEQVAFLEARAGVGVVGALVEFGGDRGRAEGYALHVDWINSLVTPEAIAINRFVESPFAHPSVMFRRELIARHGGYREGRFPEDYELWLRWLEAGVTMAKVPRVLLQWNDPPGRLSRTDPRYAPAAFSGCKADYLARWLAQNGVSSRRILAWGAGRVTRRRVEQLLARGPRIAGYIDIDPRKQGARRDGLAVMAPGNIPPPGDVFILGCVGKRGARALIREHLQQRGFIEGTDFLFAA